MVPRRGRPAPPAVPKHWRYVELSRPSQMPECTCRGGNPNCFKCGGWGWVGDDISKHRARPYSGPLSPGKTARAKRKERKAARNIPCPYCNKKVSNLDRHVSVTHADEWLQYAELDHVRSKLISNNLKRCVVCGALVNRIDKHLARVHGIEAEST